MRVASSIFGKLWALVIQEQSKKMERNGKNFFMSNGFEFLFPKIGKQKQRAKAFNNLYQNIIRNVVYAHTRPAVLNRWPGIHQNQRMVIKICITLKKTIK